ncbi:MAG: ACT domain-containing protein [Anaerolineae bacterium]
MTAETNLTALLCELRPVLHPDDYVFVATTDAALPAGLLPVGTFREDEGLTLILPRTVADAQAMPYDFVAAWITLTVPSALAAVGLTAAVATALAEAGIACNVVAARYHDHLFVPATDATRALAVLDALSQHAKGA